MPQPVTIFENTAPLTPQAALEQAVVQTLLDKGNALFGPLPTPGQCRRMYDAMPPPSCGASVFYSVWSDNARSNQGQRVRFEELFGVYVTITVRLTKPPDLWVEHRDDLECRADAVKNVLGQDQLTYNLIRAANTLAGFRSSGDQVSTKPPGWVESLLYAGMDPIQNCGDDWFHARTESPEGLRVVAIAQRVRFVAAKRIQRVGTGMVRGSN